MAGEDRNYWSQHDDYNRRIAEALEKIARERGIAEILERLVESQKSIGQTLQSMQETFEQVLEELTLIQQSLPQPLPPTGFTVTEQLLNSQGESMKTATGHTVGITLLPNGHVLFTFVTDPPGSVLPSGTPLPLTFTSSDPALAVVQDPGDPNATPPRPPDTTGLVALGTPNLPAGSTGVTGIIVTGQTTLPGATSPISGSNSDNPVDIVPAPNLPTGFKVVESNV